MEYQTSQFDYLFLLNIPIPIILNSGETLTLKTPNILDYHINGNYRKLENLFMISLLELQLNAYDFGFIADSYLELLLGARLNDPEDPIFGLLEEISNIEFNEKGITCNGVPLIEEDVLEIRFAYLLSTGKIDIYGNPLGQETSSEDEASKKLKEYEDRIKEIRGEKSEKGKKISFKEMLMLIMYELNKSSKELQELNFFGIYELYGLAVSGAYDKIRKIAAGNGLMPKDQAYKTILSD